MTAEQKATLERAGIDWQKWGERLARALPLLLAIAEIIFAEHPQPVFQEGECSHKELLQCALAKQICAAHCLSHAIAECDHE